MQERARGRCEMDTKGNVLPSTSAYFFFVYSYCIRNAQGLRGLASPVEASLNTSRAIICLNTRAMLFPTSEERRICPVAFPGLQLHQEVFARFGRREVSTMRRSSSSMPLCARL